MSLWHLREKTLITLLVSILLFSTGCSTGSLLADSKEQPAAETGGEPEQNAPPDSSQTEPVVFFDAVFERLVKKELGKEEIFPSDLESFTSISVASDEFLFLAGNGIPRRALSISMRTASNTMARNTQDTEP